MSACCGTRSPARTWRAASAAWPAWASPSPARRAGSGRWWWRDCTGRALIAPPERPDAPDFEDGGERLEPLRADFTTLRAYLAEVDLPAVARERLDALDALLEALLEPGWVRDPDHLHVLARAVRQDVPEAVDAFVRTRWWSRVAPGTEPPERHLERQLDALHGEAAGIAAALQEAEELRQRTHTRYLEDRGRG